MDSVEGVAVEDFGAVGGVVGHCAWVGEMGVLFCFQKGTGFGLGLGYGLVSFCFFYATRGCKSGE